MEKITKLPFKEWLIIILLAVSGIGGLYWFFYENTHFISSLIAKDKTFFLFDRALYYFLGGSIGLLSLIYKPIVEFFRGQSLSEAYMKAIPKVMLFSLFLMLLLPLFANLIVFRYAKGNGYSECKEMANEATWPIYRSIYSPKMIKHAKN